MEHPPDIVCVGSVHWDVIGRTTGVLRPGDDTPGRILRQPGGVMLNIARMLRHLGMAPALLSVVGRDREGDDLLAACAALGLVTDHIHRSAHLPTDSYMAIEDAGGLVAALADARSLEAAGDLILAPLTDGSLGAKDTAWAGPVVLDGNLTDAVLAGIATRKDLAKADLRLALASPAKARRLGPLLRHPGATVYLNRAEASELAGAALACAADAVAALQRLGAVRVLVTDGREDAAFGTEAGIVIASPPHVRVNRVTGAGDTLMAAHIVAERRGAGPQESLIAALAAASAFVAGE